MHHLFTLLIMFILLAKRNFKVSESELIHTTKRIICSGRLVYVYEEERYTVGHI